MYTIVTLSANSSWTFLITEHLKLCLHMKVLRLQNNSTKWSTPVNTTRGRIHTGRDKLWRSVLITECFTNGNIFSYFSVEVFLFEILTFNFFHDPHCQSFSFCWQDISNMQSSKTTQVFTSKILYINLHVFVYLLTIWEL